MRRKRFRVTACRRVLKTEAAEAVFEKELSQEETTCHVLAGMPVIITGVTVDVADGNVRSHYERPKGSLTRTFPSEMTIETKTIRSWSADRTI